jgi:transposase
VEQITRGQAVRVGVDLAKRVIQVHAVDAGGRAVTSRALVRDKFIEWCVRLPAGCVVAMEAPRVRIVVAPIEQQSWGRR